MISLVVVTLLLYRGAQYNTGHLPVRPARVGVRVVSLAEGARRSDGAYNQGVETFFLLAQMA